MICNMDSIGKYILEIILHQQRTSQLLKQKKLTQTQEDHSNPIQALNVDSLKVDLVVIQNTCSEKEDCNSETTSSQSVKESSLDYATKDVHAIKYKMLKAKERCMAYFLSLHSHLQVLSKEDLKGTHIKHGFKRAFMSLFDQDDESSETELEVQDDSSRSGTDTDVDDTDIRPIYNEEPMTKVQLTAKCNIFAIGQQHTEQLEISHEGQHGQILNETSNKAKIKKEIDVLETMNIELEYSVAKLLKENKTLKKHYKDLYDFIRITRSKTIEQKTFLLANNADLKAQIQEKVFAIAALKNDLRKLKGNSLDTKFSKTSVLEKLVLQSLRNQSVVRQVNAFKSERPQISKPWFASQVDVNNNLSRPLTQYYLPKIKEFAFSKPDHMIASSESRNSSKNMPRFSSNDMVHNHYLDEAKKKTQERYRNSKISVMPFARFQSIANGSKPKPTSTNHSTSSFPVSKSSYVTIAVVPIANHSKSSSSFSDSKHLVCSTCHKCVFNANHDACITTFLKQVNSRATIQSNKTRNSNKPVEQKSHTQKPSRKIFKEHRFSPNKTSAVYEKTSPRSDLRGKLRSVVAEKADISETSVKVDSKLIRKMSFEQHGSSLTPQCQMTFEHNSSSLEPQFVSKSFAVTTTDASDKRQQQPDLTSSTSSLATTVIADGNFDL
nr:hypothetical protein [Tanacetum cinerariifolium]